MALPAAAVPARAATQCAPAGAAAGADVSVYQPQINWTRLKGAGRGFVFIKATEGRTLRDGDFARDWSGSQAVGLARGAYHFFHPSEDAAAQAETFLAAMGPLDAGDLPPMLDLEVTDKRKASQVISSAREWLDRIESATGRVPIIYTYPAFWIGLGSPKGFDRYPLFISDFGVKCPSVPTPWTSWTFWQQKVGKLTGIAEQADIDVFNGTLEELLQL